MELVGAELHDPEGTQETAPAPSSSASYLGRLTPGLPVSGCMGSGGELAVALLALLDAKSLAALGRTTRHWRRLPHWSEHWFLLGVQDFGQRRRLVPPGRFERFDEYMLDGEV